MTAFADSQVVFRNLGEDAWGQFRLEVGGRDVTTFRDLPAQVGSYQLTEPYGYGPATFALPALTPFEVDAWGTGELKWMGNGKPVRLIQVDPAGDAVRIVWEGYVDRPNVTDAGVVLGCAGLASGRLSSRIKTSGLFADKKHIGRKIFDAMAQVNLRVTPFLGADVGAQVTERGMQSWMIDYVDGLLAATIDTDGSQYTLMPTASGQWSLALKDTDTTDCTAHYGAHGVTIDLADDLTENPNSYYGSGVAPSGLVWSNHRLPQAKQGNAPPYPMDDDSSFGEGTRDSDTDSGDGVTVMMQKLGGTGYLPRTKRPGGFDNDVTRAIKDLQDDAGLTESGNMNPNTWDALFDITTTGINLKNSFIHPLAQKSEVRQWLRTANGSIAGANPNYDPTVPQVDVFIDYGTDCEMPRARRNARGQLKRADKKNWAGTITLTADVFAGDHAHTDVSPTPMSRLDINAGQNIQLRHFDGHTLFHVSVVNVSGDLSVTLGVDVRARDAATLGELIARRIESRQHPARQWKRQHLAGVNFRKVEASEDFGVLFNKVELTGNAWNVVPILAGDAGQVSRVRVVTENDEAEFVVAFTAQKTGASFWRSMVGNPFKGTGVSGIFVSDGGSGYTSTPSVSITGGGGSGATAVAHVGTTNTVTQVVITNRGTGYTTAPTISITGGGGSGADAHSEVTLNDPWTTGKMQKVIDRDRALLGVWGDAEQPCGYYPKNHTNDQGDVTDAPITGKFLEDAGFDYHTFSDPFVYMAIYPDRDCVLKPQRILWAVEESDA